MLKIGLTGSIGSGKSTIAKVFYALGAPIYVSDIEAKKILDFPDIVKTITTKFDNNLLNEKGLINRQALASIVFNDPDALRWLNSLIHPHVRTHFQEWVNSHLSEPYIIQESAIMFETGFHSFFDKIIVVTCPEEQRFERVKSRDNMSREQFQERMENQWSEELKVKKADYIIANDDHSLALPQVLKLHKEFIKLSAKKNVV